MAEARDTRSPEWLQPAVEEQGLPAYVETLRERLWVVALAVALTLVTASLYLITADPVYEAEATVLVTPVTADDPTLASLGLIQQSADPVRAIETAATLMTTNEVIDRAMENLDGELGERLALEEASAEPVAESNIVVLSVEATSAEEAARLANALATAAVEERTAQLHREAEELIPQLEDQLGSPATTPATEQAVSTTLARLQTLAQAPTPEIRLESAAVPPASQISPRPLLTIAAALLAGLVLGTGGAFALHAIDPRLRREQQLRRQYGLPILARIPRESGAPHSPLAPRQLSPPATEAYRTLRATLAAAGGGEYGPRAILVTGSAPSEGKTTTAVNLAASLAAAGRKVILIDADLRRPAVHRVLGLEPQTGIVGVLIENISLDDALISSDTYGPDLEVLAAEHEGGWIAELFTLPSARRLIEDAKRAADYVVIDAAPLTQVSDALPLARYVDDVLIVVRLGRSHLTSIRELGELLAENGLRPAGFTVVGTAQPADSGYYQGGRRLQATPPGGLGGGRPRSQAEPASTPAPRHEGA